MPVPAQSLGQARANRRALFRFKGLQPDDVLPMTPRMILPLLFGLIGAAILIGLGTWQVQRLAWKQGVLANIEARISDAPVAVPETPDPERDLFLPVQVSGTLTGEQLRVLVSQKLVGPGHRIIAVLQTADVRRLLVDLGFVALDDARPAVSGPAQVIGNLHWPVETDSFTPAPDMAAGLWFARDVPAMAKALNTEAVFLVARAPVVAGVEPLPVDTSSIPNDHLGYAITWFSLAVVWLGMTLLLLWRIKRRTA